MNRRDTITLRVTTCTDTRMHTMRQTSCNGFQYNADPHASGVENKVT